jgi:hypothetical protein
MYRIIIYLAIVSSLYSQTDLKEVEFAIDLSNAEKVYLAGNFNEWSKNQNPLSKIDSTWQTTIKLKPGYYYYRFLVDDIWKPDLASRWRISDGGDGFNSVIKVGEPPVPVRNRNERPLPAHVLPEPILDKNPEWVELYYSTWEILWNNIDAGKSKYRAERKSSDKKTIKPENMWDQSLMTAFTMYAADVFPSMQVLDYYYAKQREDGCIPGNYTGSYETVDAENNLDIYSAHPVLFAWLELKYYDVTGSESRLKKVLPRLIDNFTWTNKNISDPTGLGIYYDETLDRLMQYGSKERIECSALINFTCQQALAAMSIANIATALGKDILARDFYIMHYFISKQINSKCWDYETSFYYDYDNSGKTNNIKHIGAFWTLLAQVSDSLITAKMIEHLVNPDEFWRPHLVPSVSADNNNYDSLGCNKRGAVWSPANYMLVKGLEINGYYDLANQIAANHLRNLASVYNHFVPDENTIAYEERYADGYNTIWESYSPEFLSPAARWDNNFLSRQDFAGGSGFGPVSMLIENIIGLELRGCRNKIIWRISREDRHGIKNLNFRGDKIDLICTPDANQYEFTVKCSSPFTLVIQFDDREFVKKIDFGNTAFSLER